MTAYAMGLKQRIVFVMAMLLVFGGQTMVAYGQTSDDQGEEHAGVSHLTVMTYNIHVGIGMDGVLDLERIGRVIADGQAAVVGLQEVDQNTARSGGVDQAEKLGEITGMDAVYGPAYAYRGGYFGPATLSSLPIEEQKVIHLPHKEGNEGRVVVVTRVKWHDTLITILNTHLEHADPGDRAAQGAALADIVAEYVAVGPTILVGDLNAEPSEMSVLSGLWRHVRDTYGLALARAMRDGDDAVETLGDGFTFDSAGPTKRIDYVWVSDHFDLADVSEPLQILESDASDHLPLVVHLKLTQ